MWGLIIGGYYRNRSLDVFWTELSTITLSEPFEILSRFLPRYRAVGCARTVTSILPGYIAVKHVFGSPFVRVLWRFCFQSCRKPGCTAVVLQSSVVQVKPSGE